MPISRDGERLEVVLSCTRSELVRLWLGCKLMALGARLLGCPMRIRVVEPDLVESPAQQV